MNRNTFSKIFMIIVVSLSSYSCDESVKPDPKIPIVSTLTASAKENESVTLVGELSGVNEISNHGFWFTSDTSDWNKFSEKVDLGKPKSNGRFEKKFFQGILSGKTYYFKAYIKVNSNIIFGKALSFVSRGGKFATISRVEPEKGHLEEEIQIFGEGFGNDAGLLIVYFDDIGSNYYTITPTKISAVIPPAIKSPQFTIRLVEYYGAPDATYSYSLATPEVIGFEPTEPKLGEKIRIKGNHFDKEKTRNQVKFNGISAEIISSSRDEIEAIIPTNLTNSELEIEISAQLQTVKIEQKINIAPPIIESYPTRVRVMDIIEIKGKNFNPGYGANKVMFNEHEAKVIDGNTEFLMVEIPDNAYPNGFANLKILVAGQEANGNQTIEITDEWLMVDQDLPFSFYASPGTFVINHTAYVMANSKNFNDNKTYLWQFNPNTSSWTQIGTPFTNATGVIAHNSSKAYYFSNGENGKFWEYDPSLDKWTQKTDLPGAKREDPMIFSFDEKIYVGLGRVFNTANPINSGFYEYNPLSDSWRKLGDPPITNRFKPNAFVFDSKVMVFNGAADSGGNTVFQYSPSNDSWKELTPLEEPRSGTFSFVMNDKGYTSNGSSNSFEYNPFTDQWIPSFPMGYKYRSAGFSFVVDGKAYIGGGDTFPEGGTGEIFIFRK
ncbi:IPT/TIG domain-containing protein [Shivajiella indica]|uniref:IPT/TIG domain-containing protein n=1 Tax=Shivajiella indica TaxID=872115 RepID=A0ABW5BAR7_9BACT